MHACVCVFVHASTSQYMRTCTQVCMSVNAHVCACTRECMNASCTSALACIEFLCTRNL